MSFHHRKNYPKTIPNSFSKSANQDLKNRLLNLESANLMQELQSINSKCIAKIDFVDNKYEYLMDRTLTLQSEVVTTQTLCKEERLSLTDKIRSLESCVSEEHKRWYDSMKNLESLAREEVHSLEQTLCARLQALEETLCKHDKEPNKQKVYVREVCFILVESVYILVIVVIFNLDVKLFIHSVFRIFTVFIVMCRGDLLFWSSLVGILYGSCIFDRHLLL
ncbi:hypothetical protein STEG23_003694 [Scotinomys teguina]